MNIFLDNQNESISTNINSMNHHSSNKRLLLTYISCTITEMFNRSWGVFLPTGYTGAGSSSNCSCYSGLTFNSSDPLRFCMCTDTSLYMMNNNSCVTQAYCNSIGRVAYEGYCMDCPSGATISGNTCNCSSRTDGKIYWRVNQCVPCEKTEYTTGNQLFNGSCACFRGQTTAYINFNTAIHGSSRIVTIYLQAYFKIKLGTCYVEGGKFSGSSTIYLSRNGSTYSSNNNYSHSSCSGGGNYLVYTPTISDYYSIQIICNSSTCNSDLSYSIENIELQKAYGYYSSTETYQEYINYGSFTGRTQDLMLNNLSIGDYIILDTFMYTVNSFPYRGKNDPHVYLYNGSNTQVVSSDDSGTLNSRINYKVPSSDNFYIKLASHNVNPTDANYLLIIQKYKEIVKDFDSNITPPSFTSFSDYHPYSYNNVCYKDCSSTTVKNDNEYICSECSYLIIDMFNCSSSCPNSGDYINNGKYCYDTCLNSSQFIYNKECLTDCPTGKGVVGSSKDCNNCPSETPYIYNNICIANCPSGLGSLNGVANCVTCPVVLHNNVCYNSCPTNTGKIPNDSYNCITCPHVLYNADCYDECPDNTGLTITNTYNCNPCPNYIENDYCVNQCNTNRGIYGTNKNCTTCLSSEFIDIDYKCVSTCQNIGYGIVEAGKYCEVCADTISHIYILDNMCIENCPGLLGTDTDNYCVECPNTKQHLFENVCREDCPYDKGRDGNIRCVTCPLDKHYIHDYTCLSECPFLLGTDIDNYCVECPYTKQQLFENVCREDCPYNMGKDTNIYCVECPSNKPYISDYTCLESCPDGLGISTSGMTCMVCPHDKPYIFENYCVYKCPESLGVVSFDTCQECPESSPLVMNNQCVQNCDSKYGLMENSNMCIVCDRDFPLLFEQNCVTECPENYGLMLADSYYECLKCPNNMSFIYESRCIEQCPEGYGSINDSIYCNLCEEPNIYLHERKCLSTCPEKTYMDDVNKKCSSSCRESTKYIVDGKCSSSCPEGYGMFNSGKTNVFCGECTGDLLLFNDGFCKKSNQCDNTLYYVDLENNKCVNCSKTNNPIYFDGKCIAKCPSGYTLDESKCELTTSIDSSSSNSTDTGNSTDSSSSPPKVVTCTTGQVKVTDADGNEACFSCKILKKYVENGVCVEKCSGNANFDSSTNECLVCGSKFTQKTSTGYTCVDKCDSTNGYFVDSASTSSCVKCSDSGKFIQDSKCVNKCKNYYTSNSSGICISCSESDKKYIVDTACVASCPEGYTIKTVSGRENTCTFIKKDPTCTSSYCQNNGKCSVESNGKLKCTCTGDFKGSLCDKTTTDIQNIGAKVSESLNKLNSLNSTTPLSSSDLDEISSIKELIKEAPEIVSDEMLNNLMSITSNQLKLVKNLTVDNMGIMNLVDTAFTAYSQSSQSGSSSIDITEVKDSVNKLTSSLTSSITDINEFISNSGSSVLYSGDTFSIQLTDNSNDSLNESRKSKLTIVDYDQCTNILREAGVIGENENLYAQNVLFDSSLSSNKNSSDVSSSNSISTVIVNQYGKEVNTTLCNAFTYKMPINNNVIDVETQLNLSEQLGVDIFNSSDTFFTDICFSYPNNGTDVTVSSRRSKYNVTAGCSSGCTYNGVDEYGYTLCDCPSTSGETSSAFEESVFDSLLKSNIVLFKCVDNLLTMDVIYNAGFWAVSLISSFCVIVIVFHNLTFNKNKNINKIVMNDAISIDPKMVGQINHPKKVISTSKLINSYVDKNKNMNICIYDDKVSSIGNLDSNINNKNQSQFQDTQNNIKILDDNFNLNINIRDNNQIINKYANIIVDDTEKSVSSSHNSNFHIINYVNKINNNGENNKNFCDNLISIPFRVGKISKDSKKEEKDNIINNNISHYEVNNNESIVHENNANNVLMDRNNPNNNYNSSQRPIQTNSLVKTFMNKSKFSMNKLETSSNKTFFSKDANNITTNKESNSIRQDNTSEIKEVKDISHDKDVSKYNVKTSRDLMELPIEIAVKLDKRSLLQFIWDDLKISHPYLNIFLIKSILNPFIIRFLGIMFGISMECALNAMFFTDDYIDQQADLKSSEGEASTGFFYTLLNEFSRSFWPVIISNIIVLFTGFVLIIPKAYKKQLNINLLADDINQQINGV